jgi:CHAT domain-containing protein
MLFADVTRVLRSQPPIAGLDDGMLTAMEASAMDLDGTELVVLSACETALGEVHAAEGVFGLRRAFAEAGAQTVMMSMWKVPDETTHQLMAAFFSNWLGGMEKHAALSAAQQTVRSQPGHGSVLLGRLRPCRPLTSYILRFVMIRSALWHISMPKIRALPPLDRW